MGDLDGIMEARVSALLLCPCCKTEIQCRGAECVFGDREVFRSWIQFAQFRTRRRARAVMLYEWNDEGGGEYNSLLLLH